ncbi:hypothetical protein [Tunturibacter empetritectus]|uniref:Uncharacterized protein n=1 Tax=Tunturiibacter empetritectus TaxID=3069691 RepID=A0A7W8MPV2_9BACT|nr:hypothetical protein [Edaphobacter lichenicola]MBB5315868.1 hypothetical protein [Edaphobacter lichenicola]
MSSSLGQTDVLKNGRSEGQFLLFTGKKTQLDSIANAVDIDRLAPLLVGMAAAIIIVILYAFLLGKLG